ncbi:ribosome biogenesis GTPase Der [Rickettsiales endosymbiont of Stachyamoeba lipophora]|uniref:ribosome biogenesis GTPase Der n=1 Tax=Rickettsiales endosymbiont of Stachyamoeba lipophora TaxID=2486578 RepID=UPI000F655A77|nr:ribosome biogenesis GTPase Der [Rickettsiales endosymbiont of Stachyamoeba lipophora]AZL15649.1 ribosome biogenesis GTPase Der [Rickettsiales endosymbiont of Stachyamoeba lipophora]
MHHRKLKVALVGRPNVGKSTLFNRLVGNRFAIVEDTPGVTRDYRFGKAHFGELEFEIIDTAGLEKAFSELSKKMTDQSLKIIQEVDLVLFVIDATTGLTHADLDFAKIIRKLGKATITIVNKCESRAVRDNIQDGRKLGFDEVIGVSAAHGDGVIDLYEYLIEFNATYFQEELEQSAQDDTQAKPYLQVSIVGRPNAGKSTLINSFVGYERMLTGPEPGITRDAISIDWDYKGKWIKLVDTAGMRKKSMVNEELEKLSYHDAKRAVEFSQVVIVLMDINNALEKQDLSIIEHAIDEGRGVVLGFNKIDTLTAKQRKEKIAEIEYLVHQKISLIIKVPIIFLSATKQQNSLQVIDEATKVYEQWKKRITTAKLNEWLEKATSAHPLPMGPMGKRVKIKYATQHKTRPPSFLLFTTRPELIDKSYMKYLTKSLAEYFDLNATPLRLYLKKKENPYVN